MPGRQRLETCRQGLHDRPAPRTDGVRGTAMAYASRTATGRVWNATRRREGRDPRSSPRRPRRPSTGSTTTQGMGAPAAAGRPPHVTRASQFAGVTADRSLAAGRMQSCLALRPTARDLALCSRNVWAAASRLTAVSPLLRTGRGGRTARAHLCPTAPRARTGDSVIARP